MSTHQHLLADVLTFSSRSSTVQRSEESWGSAAGGDQQVDVGVVREVPHPGVKHDEDAEGGPHPSGIGGERVQGRGGPE